MSTSQLREALDALDQEQAELAIERATAEEKLAAAKEQLKTTKAQLADHRERLQDMESQAAQFALQRYQDRGMSTTAILLTSGGNGDIVEKMTVMQQVTNAADSLITSLLLAQSTLTELELTEQNAVNVIEAERAAIAASEAESIAKSAKIVALLDQMARAAAASSALSSGHVSASSASILPSGSLRSPMSRYVITDYYGMRVHPFTGGWTFHDAMDLAAPCGTAITAPANGVVTDYYWGGSYGNRIIIDHGWIGGKHVVTSSNHLSGAAVSVGSVVSQGQVVAYVGTTGSSTGCHNHYQIYMDGQTVNPSPYI
jgi:murein DD-endopeptidase MepM/ murein hydrolase activator NlpD